MDYRIFPPEEILETTVQRLPLSKSVAARAMVLAALTPEAPAPSELPDCDDIDVMARALATTSGAVNINASGTALRFLTAYYAATPGADVLLEGTERLCTRPVAPLVDALRRLGADIEYTANDGCAPLRIRGRRLDGGTVRLDASLSSQYASALAMIAPAVSGGLTIDLGGQIPSRPYLDMTLAMMRRRGIDAVTEGYSVIIPEGPYNPIAAECEPDWSAASYWYAIAALTAGWVTLPRLHSPSLQGDSALADMAQRIGVVTEFGDDGAELSASPEMFSRLDLDMSDTPDLVPALAVAAAMVGMPFVFTGVANLRIKESDRIDAIMQNFRRLGILASASDDTLSWEGDRMPIAALPEFDTFNDHRIAMAFAATSVFVPGIVVKDCEVVEKSYPGFWDDLRDAGFTLADPSDPIPEPSE